MVTPEFVKYGDEFVITPVLIVADVSAMLNEFEVAVASTSALRKYHFVDTAVIDETVSTVEETLLFSAGERS